MDGTVRGLGECGRVNRSRQALELMEEVHSLARDEKLPPNYRAFLVQNLSALIGQQLRYLRKRSTDRLEQLLKNQGSKQTVRASLIRLVLLGRLLERYEHGLGRINVLISQLNRDLAI